MTQRVGFTLIELLVVVGLLVVAAAMIVPRMGRSVGQRELAEVVSRFVYTARTVRELAVSTGQVCTLEIDLDRHAYAVSMASSRSAGGGSRRVQMSWLKGARWPEAVRVLSYQTPSGASATSGVQRVLFLPDGTSSGAAIRLGDQTSAREIVIRPHNGQVASGDDQEGEALGLDRYDLGD